MVFTRLKSAAQAMEHAIQEISNILMSRVVRRGERQRPTVAKRLACYRKTAESVMFALCARPRDGLRGKVGANRHPMGGCSFLGVAGSRRSPIGR